MADKIFIVKNGLQVNTTLIFANNGFVSLGTQTTNAFFTVNGTSYFAANVFINGAITVSGNTVVQGTQVFQGNNNPNANGINLGNTTARWLGFFTGIDVSGTSNLTGNVAFAGNFSIGNTTVNTFANSTFINIANSTTSANLTSVSLTIGPSVVNTTAVAANSFIVKSGANTITISTGTLPASYNWNLPTTPGTPGQLLTSQGGGANSMTWTTPSTNAAGSNTQVQFNDSNAFAGSASFTFNKTTNNVTVANALSAAIGSFSANVQVGANVLLTTGVLSIGNTTANMISNSTFMSFANSTAAANITPSGMVTGVLSANASGIFIGANISINTQQAFFGNSTWNAVLQQSSLNIANSTASAVHSALGFSAGGFTLSTTGIFHGATSVAYQGDNISEFVNNSGYITVGNLAGGYGSLYSYTIMDTGGGSDPFTPGANYGGLALGGTWQAMSGGIQSLQTYGGYGGKQAAVMFQRVA